MKRLALLVFLSCSLAIHADELDNPSVQPIPSDDLLCLSLPGFRFGLGSVAEDSAGVQIGLVNGFGSEGGTRWLPLLNARF
jgi:hypothetical protein